MVAATALPRAARRHARRALHRLRPPAGVDAYLAAHPTEPRLHLGCGGALLDGWLNTDRDPSPGATYLDLGSRFPLADDAFSHVLAEHVIEHLPLAGGRAMLGEAARVLRPGGRVRVSTPDLDRLLALRCAPGEAGRRYLEWAATSFAPGARGTPPALVLNHVFRAWGHQFLYDEETLGTTLADAGFEDVVRLPYARSDDPVFDGAEGRGIDALGREMRAYETVALEARLPGGLSDGMRRRY